MRSGTDQCGPLRSNPETRWPQASTLTIAERLILVSQAPDSSPNSGLFMGFIRMCVQRMLTALLFIAGGKPVEKPECPPIREWLQKHGRTTLWNVKVPEVNE